LGDFNIALLPMDESSSKKKQEQKQKQKQTNKQTNKKENAGVPWSYKLMNLIEFYRPFYPNSKEYTLFSAPHRIYSIIEHIHSTKQVSTDAQKLK
jgi:exonuclease III